MATIVLSSYMVRHPLGGVLASNLQLIWGFSRLGHDVYVFEQAGYPKSCFDPIKYVSDDDCTYGVAAVERVLRAAGLEGRLCFVSSNGAYNGLQPAQVREVFSRCDLLIDRGDHRLWTEEAHDVPVRVLVDPDPGYRQVKLAEAVARGCAVPDYDAFYTYGYHVGDGGRSPVPRAGLSWRHMFHPVDTERIVPSPAPLDAAFTTVMNWTSHKAVSFAGASYGMKDVEFERFIDLPSRTSARLEVAVEGKEVPVERLHANGWYVRPAVAVTATLESYLDYIRSSAGEFSVVKEVYRGLDVGWFSDRSAAYLAMGRPVIVQDNGLDGVLPTGEGLFSVSSVEEAAAAIDAVQAEPARHADAARAIAVEHLSTTKVLGRFLTQLGLPAHG
jgi:hypothetical protein